MTLTQSPHFKPWLQSDILVSSLRLAVPGHPSTSPFLGEMLVILGTFLSCPHSHMLHLKKGWHLVSRPTGHITWMASGLRLMGHRQNKAI